MAPFHFSFHVRDLESARRFYRDLLGCAEGRSTDLWVDFDFFGNQISAHVGPVVATTDTARVDGTPVPMPHFGAILGWDELFSVWKKLQTSGCDIVLPYHVRFAGKPGEQALLFVRDFSGNALELKAFRSSDQVFAT